MSRRNYLTIFFFVLLSSLVWRGSLYAAPDQPNAPTRPYPQHVTHAPGTIRPNHRSQTQLDADVSAFYDYWKTNYIVQAGTTAQGNPLYRVAYGKTSPNKERTVSEGQGYGMVITAIMAGYDPNAQLIFDGLWEFVLAHPSQGNSNLMDWDYPSTTSGNNSAFDGDADIAYGLLLAEEQWGNGGRINYGTSADTVIAAILQSTVGPNSRWPMLGDWVNPNGSPHSEWTTRPSDFMISHFRAYQLATGNAAWGNVISTIQGIITTIQTNNSPTTGLLPDFVVTASSANRTPIPAPANFLEGANDGNYYYNSGRTPWRIGVDGLLNNNATSLTQARKISTWAESTTGGNPSQFRAGYKLDGTNITGSNYFTSFFVSPLGVAAMTSPTQQTWLNAIYSSVYARHEDYFEDSVNLLCLLIMSGNYWQPSNAPIATPTPTATTGATATPTKTPTVPVATATATATPISSSCTAPQYVAGTAYTQGQIVKNIGRQYRCDIAGWCSSSGAWAYEPGVGSAWTQAWTDVGECSSSATATPTNTPIPATATPIVPTNTPIPATATPTTASNLPDLLILFTAITLENGGCYHGQPLGTRVTIKNGGTANAGAFTVTINGTNRTVAGLASNAETTIWVTGYTNPTVVTLDSLSQVAESNEGNNSFNAMVPVPTPPIACTATPTPTATPSSSMIVSAETITITNGAQPLWVYAGATQSDPVAGATINLTYDPAQLSVSACDTAINAVGEYYEGSCNLNYIPSLRATTTIRASVTTSTPQSGAKVPLLNITVRCATGFSGTANLNITESHLINGNGATLPYTNQSSTVVCNNSVPTAVEWQHGLGIASVSAMWWIVALFVILALLAWRLHRHGGLLLILAWLVVAVLLSTENTHASFLTSVQAPTLKGGDVNCDGVLNVVDGLFIRQYGMGTRPNAGSCPLPASSFSEAECDLNRDNLCNSADTTAVLNCVVALPNTLCFGITPTALPATNTPTAVPATNTPTPTSGTPYTCTHPYWKATSTYQGNEQVTYLGHTWKAQWWTQGEIPGQATVWADMGQCGPAWTPTPVPINQPPAWPNRFFAPFIDATGWPVFDYIGIAQQYGVRYYALGFVVAKSSSTCAASWGTYYDNGEILLEEINSLRGMGGDVIVSFGGAANTELAGACGSAAQLQAAYQAVIDTYNLTHIDFDIEGFWVANRPTIDRRSQAIKLLQNAAATSGRELKVWFTLPVLPTGLTADGIYVLQSAINAGVEIAGVNIMAMDYGSSAAPNPEGKMGQYAIDAGTSLFNQIKTLYGSSKTDAQLWKMVGITPMIGMNDVTTEIFRITDAQQLLAWAQQKNIGMLSIWSGNRDKQCAGGEIGSVEITCSSILQSPYQFTTTFLPFTQP